MAYSVRIFEYMKRNVLRGLIGGLSFTSALFIFQACYGTPQDLMQDFLVEGKVVSLSNGEPIEGIRVSLDTYWHETLTDKNGEFSFYAPFLDQMKLIFEDIDGTEHGSFKSKDTLVSNLVNEAFVDQAFVNVELEAI